MRDETAFAGTVFLGLAREAKRDPYRLGLFAKHLDPDERPLVLLPVRDATLVVTDRRILELRPHLEVDGAWNVRRFDGFAVERATPREDVHRVERHVGVPREPQAGTAYVEERLVFDTVGGAVDILVSHGPRAVLTEHDVSVLRAAILEPHAM